MLGLEVLEINFSIELKTSLLIAIKTEKVFLNHKLLINFIVNANSFK